MQREYEFLQRLQITGIARPLELLCDAERTILVLEDFDGVGLLECAARRPDPVSCTRIAINLVGVLEALHALGIVHRDLRLANLLVAADGRVCVVDCSAAAAHGSDGASIASLPADLSCIAPEQTGHVCRPVDARSDLYAVGGLLYLLLCRQLPFAATEPAELLHSHLARRPVPPRELDPAIPQTLSAITTKLLEKAAEDRYQSASSLRIDLEEGRRQLLRNGTIDPFPLAASDLGDRLRRVTRLFGRARSLQQLRDAFERARTGAARLVLVAGAAGIGKTALVEAVQPEICESGGRWIRGKFDQYQRNVPCGALVIAFRSLLRELLSGGESELEAWRARLRVALGSNGSLVTAVLPELELIIGPQPPVQALAPHEARNRFELTLRSFVRLFCRPERPLVLFLDDLQWVDSATLRLLELLVRDRETRHLLLIGSYRDNEVDAGHPLSATIRALAEEEQVQRIALDLLEAGPVCEWLAAVLGQDAEDLAGLAELVVRRTAGNPFFAGQFLRTLHRERLLQFDAERRRWRWDSLAIEQLRSTDDVSELLGCKLAQLPPATQRALCLAACIGNRFDLDTLAWVYETSPAALAELLQPALAIDLIEQTAPRPGRGVALPAGDEAAVHRFVHDRVQQAAYGLAGGEREAVHLHVGRTLLRAPATRELEERLFDVVGHLNRGRAHVTSAGERRMLVELNLSAARKATSSTAYREASAYLDVARELLAEDAWTGDYQLALQLNTAAAELAYLLGDFERSEQHVALVLHHARDVLDQVPAYNVKIQVLQAQTRLREAVELGIQLLARLGVELPGDAGEPEVDAARIRTAELLHSKTRSELLALPAMTDPYKRAAVRLITGITSSAYNATPRLYPLTVFAQVSLSVQYGNDDESPMAYATYGLLLCSAGDIDRGYQFAGLAIALLERFTARRNRGRTLFVCSYFVNHWKLPLRDTLPAFAEGYACAMESGDLEQAGYCLCHGGITAFLAGQPLAGVHEQLCRDRVVLARLRQRRVCESTSIFERLVAGLLGVSPQSPAPLLEEEDLANQFFTHFGQVLSGCLDGDQVAAVTHADAAARFLDGVKSTAVVPVYHFYDAMARLGCLAAGAAGSARQRQQVERSRDLLRFWATHAPANHLHRVELVEAELACIDGRFFAATTHYERAVQAARDHGYLPEEALALERAAAFHESAGNREIAQHYRELAVAAYGRWGAQRKVAQLSAQPAAVGRPRVAVRREERLESRAVVDALQAVSSEIVLDRLVRTLMTIAVKMAGAQAGYLVLGSGDLLQVVAEYPEQGELRVASGRALEASAAAPASLIRYAMRTGRPVVLGEPVPPGSGAEPATAREWGCPRSVACVPMLRHGQTVGVICLTNELVELAFPPDRVKVIELLAAQAAISLENARLYADLQAENAERRRAEEALRDSQQLLQAIVDSSTAVIYVKDLTGRYLFISRRFEELFHVRKDAPLDDRMIFPAALVDRLQANDRAVLAAGEPLEFEEVVHLDDGPHTFVSVKSPLRDVSGAIFAICGVSTDISELKRTQEELAQVQKMEMVGRLAGGIAHDFNNLLTAIRCCASLARSRVARQLSPLAELADIEQAAESAASLTGQLLAFARRQVVQPQALDLNGVLLDMTQMLRRVLGETIECVMGLSSTSCTVRMDRTQAEQVIMNLAVNARDAMPQGGRLSFATRIVHREGHTGRSAGRPGEYVCLTVADTGSGMDERVMRHLFEPFFTTKEVGRGTGLGLATCHGIVHQNHGFIEVASDLGRGTTFAVYLPRSVGAAAECRTRDGGAISRGTETLLVVEDSQCVRAAIASSLRHHGYRILEAMDGGQALDIARQHQGRIDAVVSDVVMPGMNGRELVRRLREEGHRARMLLMSGYCGEASAREQDDGIDVIQKPFDPEQLVARLRTLLDGDGGPARQRSGPGG